MDERSWASLQVKHLLALDAVAACGSFHAAARALGYSQSAVSQQIAALEAIVGDRLLTRPSRRGERVTATPSGEVLLAESAAIVARLRAADQRLAALREGRSTVVRVGVPYGLAGFVLGHALDGLARTAPGVEVELAEATADTALFDLLDRGDIDLAFVVVPPRAGAYGFESLLRDEFLLIALPTCELAGLEPLDLDDLHAAPLLCLRRCRATIALLGRLAERGVEPDVAFRSDDATTLLGLLGRDADAALLPALAVPEVSRLAVRTFASHPYRPLGLAWHESRPPAGGAQAFVDVCRSLLAGERRLAPLREGEPPELRVSLSGVR